MEENTNPMMSPSINPNPVYTPPVFTPKRNNKKVFALIIVTIIMFSVLTTYYFLNKKSSPAVIIPPTMEEKAAAVEETITETKQIGVPTKDEQLERMKYNAQQ